MKWAWVLCTVSTLNKGVFQCELTLNPFIGFHVTPQTKLSDRQRSDNYILRCLFCGWGIITKTYLALLMIEKQTYNIDKITRNSTHLLLVWVADEVASSLLAVVQEAGAAV